MDLCNKNHIQALLGRHGFHFSKALGQNFLIDGSVPLRIAEGCDADERYGVLREHGEEFAVLPVLGVVDEVAQFLRGVDPLVEDADRAIFPLGDGDISGFTHSQFLLDMKLW